MSAPGDRPSYPLEHLLELEDGRIVEWEAIGAGPPLLWIEGGPGLPAHLARPDVELVSDRFRAYLVNAPGSGRSSPPATADGYGLEASVRYFDDVRRRLGLERVTLMGHSWGGLIGLALTLAVPEAVERLVLIDAYAGEASIPEPEAVAERERAFDRLRGEPWFEGALAAFDDERAVSPEAFDKRFEACWPLYFSAPGRPNSRHHIARLQRETRWNLGASDAWWPEGPNNLLPDLATIRCPTLVVVGEHDFICGPAWNRPIAAAIPGARYAEIAGAGHMPQYEAPELFRRIILDWLDAPPD